MKNYLLCLAIGLLCVMTVLLSTDHNEAARNPYRVPHVSCSSIPTFWEIPTENNNDSICLPIEADSSAASMPDAVCLSEILSLPIGSGRSFVQRHFVSEDHSTRIVGR